jgi:signal transduction histidine kinase
MSVPLSTRLGVSAATAVLVAAGVGFATAQNPAAAPLHFAALARVLVIGVLFATGIYAQTSTMQARMGALLVATGLFASVWLLNGSSDPVPFSLGVAVTGVAPVVLAFLMLAHPAGHLRSRVEASFLTSAAVVLETLWLVGMLVARQPPLKTPLLRCSPRCPGDVFAAGSSATPPALLQHLTTIALVAVLVGTALLLTRRYRAAPLPLRRSIAPVWILSLAIAVTGTLYLAALAFALSITPKLGAPYIATSVLFPLVILLGLIAERLSLAQALADFMNKLGADPAADPQALMSEALDDPGLRIAYRRPGVDEYVDSAGQPVGEPGGGTAVTVVEHAGRPIAAVSYNADLHEQEQYVHAAAAAAMMRLEKAQLEAELKAATTELAASRGRVLEMAYAERRRIERDLHDGVQQQLVGLRIKLDLAADVVRQDPEKGERALAALGEEMDQALQSVRALGRGIYPSLLRDSGLREALKSAARSSPVRASVSAPEVDRYPEEVEVAVYFCCLEALQNVVKHAGNGANATIRLWRDGSQLCFSVRDNGVGFAMDDAAHGKGLANMRDRVQAIGGTLVITSRPGGGASVVGAAPVPPMTVAGSQMPGDEKPGSSEL